MSRSEKIDWITVWLTAKKYVLAVVLGVGSALTTIWGVAALYLEDYVDQRIEIYQQEEHKKNKPLREILSEELNIPADVVPYHMAVKFTEIDSIQSNIEVFQDEYMPFLERQMTITVIYRFIDENGVEWWHGPDGYDHGIMYDDEGRAWVVYHSRKRYI